MPRSDNANNAAGVPATRRKPMLFGSMEKMMVIALRAAGVQGMTFEELSNTLRTTYEIELSEELQREVLEGRIEMVLRPDGGARIPHYVFRKEKS